MVLSHADNDHACGLIGILEHFKVLNLWMNRPWLYVNEVIDSFHGNWTSIGLEKQIRDAHPYLVELEVCAESKGVPIHEVFQGAQIGQFRVLAPSRARYVRLVPELGKTPQSYDTIKSSVFDIFETAKGAIESVREYWDFETLDDNPPVTSASNETSVVQLATLDGKHLLLTADVGPEGLVEAAQYASNMGLFARPDVIQVPHHGSRRN